MRFCAPDGIQTDKFIQNMDNIVFPIDPGSPRAGYANQWLSPEANHDFLRKVIVYRQGIKHEARLDLAVIALKWTCRDRAIESLEPHHISMANLTEAIRWSVCKPTAQIRPMAEAAQRLRKFFEEHLPSLVRLPTDGNPSDKGDSKAIKHVSQDVFNAKSQLFVLDKLFFSSVSLVDRFHETVLPSRLISSEIAQRAQSSAVAALIARQPGNASFTDLTPYWKMREFKFIRRNLQRFLLTHLKDHRELKKITDTIHPQDRIAYVKRLIILAICCCCSQNFKNRDAPAAFQDLYSLQRLPLLCEDVEFWALRPALNGLAHADRQLGTFIDRLIKVADALGDPLQVVIDPLSWQRMRVTGSQLRSGIPKVFLHSAEGNLELSSTENREEHSAPQNPMDKITAEVDGAEEEDVPLKDDADTFEASTRKLEDLEAEVRAAQSNPVVIRYLNRWARQYTLFQRTTQSLTGADRKVLRELNSLKLRPRVRHALFSHACRALSHASQSSHEDGRVVLIWIKADRALHKSIVESHNKGNAVKWLRDFRSATIRIEKSLRELRVLLHAEVDPSEVTAQSERIIEAVAAFDQEYRCIIDAFYVKQGVQRQVGR